MEAAVAVEVGAAGPMEVVVGAQLAEVGEQGAFGVAVVAYPVEA